MVTINIGRKEMVFFGAIILVFAVVGMAVAFGGTQPDVMGHSIGELAGVQKAISGDCNNKVMVGVYSNGTVICETDDTGGGGLTSCSLSCNYACPRASCSSGYSKTGVVKACNGWDDGSYCCRVSCS